MRSAKRTNWQRPMPPPEHILNLLGTAGACPPLASTIANNFDPPPAYFPWWADAGECERFIGMQMAKLASPTDAASAAQVA